MVVLRFCIQGAVCRAEVLRGKEFTFRSVGGCCGHSAVHIPGDGVQTVKYDLLFSVTEEGMMIRKVSEQAKVIAFWRNLTF